MSTDIAPKAAMIPFPRITRDPAVMSGRACIRDTHVTTSTIVTLKAAGRSQEDIFRMFPMLTPEDLREALAYAAWLLDEQAPLPPATPEAESQAAAPAQSLPRLPAEPQAPVEEQPEAALSTGEESLAAAEEEEEEVEESLELFHPDFPDQATVVVTRHGLYDRRWATHTIAWSDIRVMHRKSSKKTIEVVLRNPEFYITSMPFFKRLRAQIKLALNIQTLCLDTASLGIRTRDLYHAANRLWIRHRGRVRFRKKRRMRVNGRSAESHRPVEWDRYQPM